MPLNSPTRKTKSARITIIFYFNLFFFFFAYYFIINVRWFFNFLKTSSREIMTLHAHKKNLELVTQQNLLILNKIKFNASD